MPANAAERKLLHRMLALGLGLTACAIALELLGWLAPLEGYFFDERVRHCQFTVPPPTKQLVHLDIDQSTLQIVGSWPWHRSVIADIVRELHGAGAKVMGWDVIFADPAHPSPVPDDDRERTVDGDELFGKAIAEAKNTILPVDFSFDRPRGTPAHYRQVLDQVHENLEITQDQLNQNLVAKHAAPATEDEFNAAMRDTSMHRLEAEFLNGTPTFDDVKQKLLPQLQSQLLGGSIQASRLKHEYDNFIAWQAAQKLFPYYDTKTTPQLLEPVDEELPVAKLAASMMGCGFVTEGVGDTAIIRSLPLYADYRGELIPQFGFAASLAYLGVKPEEVKINSTTIVIPGHGHSGGDIVIPIHNESITGYGSKGTFIDVPLIGTRDWETMYDYPNHSEIRQHYPLASVALLRAARQKIKRNNELADKAMHDLFDANSQELKDYEKRPHDMLAADAMAGEVKQVEDLCRQIIAVDEELKKEEFEKLSAKDKDQYQAAKALLQIPVQNAQFVPLIKGAQEVLRQRVEGKLVLIGSTASGTDLRTTSLHTRCPGVVVHGAIFNAIMTGYFWRRLPEWATLLAIFGVGMAATVTASYLRPLGALLCTMLIGLGYAAVTAIVVFGHYRTLLGMAGPLVAVFLIWAVIPIIRYLAEATLRHRIQRRFSTYVDPALVSYLADHPEKMRLDGEMKEITVVFTDIAGFTALTEKMRERAVDILSEYMALVIPLIRSRHGYVSKFVGDGLMFFYGAPLENPSQAEDAVDTACEMLAAVDEFASAMVRRGLDKLGLRIGINTATMVVGDTGIDTAADYTPLGDGMNLGSRLEGANKMFGTRILVSARTVYQLDGRYLVRKIANLIVKGKTEAVMAFEPICRAEQATDSQKKLASLTDAMVDAYIAMEFEKCLELANAIDQEYGKSKLTAVYRERAENCLQSMPAAFNGTILLSEK